MKRFPVDNILGYVSGLEQAITDDDLVDMRRHENANRYIDSFERCEREIKRILSERDADPQMSIFSFNDHDADEFTEEDDEIIIENMI